MKFKVIIKKTAKKELVKLEKKIQLKVARIIDSLSENPYPNGCKKLRGKTNYYRIRSGDYRIIYSVEKQRLIIEIIKIGQRQDIYQSF